MEGARQPSAKKQIARARGATKPGPVVNKHHPRLPGGGDTTTAATLPGGRGELLYYYGPPRRGGQISCYVLPGGGTSRQPRFSRRRRTRRHSDPKGWAAEGHTWRDEPGGEIVGTGNTAPTRTVEGRRLSH